MVFVGGCCVMGFLWILGKGKILDLFVLTSNCMLLVAILFSQKPVIPFSFNVIHFRSYDSSTLTFFFFCNMIIFALWQHNTTFSTLYQHFLMAGHLYSFAWPYLCYLTPYTLHSPSKNLCLFHNISSTMFISPFVTFYSV